MLRTWEDWAGVGVGMVGPGVAGGSNPRDGPDAGPGTVGPGVVGAGIAGARGAGMTGGAGAGAKLGGSAGGGVIAGIVEGSSAETDANGKTRTKLGKIR